MPAPVFKASPRLPTISIAPGLWAVLFMFTQTAAADVLVVTDSHHPVQASVGVRVIELDLPARIEAKIATDLPNDPDKATTLVRQRLRDGGDALQRRIGHAYQGVADAWGLGIAKIPAVVVDRRYVVYGEPDVSRAVARINAYRSTQP
ncbi:TPA: TIGR03757 family integrating conjugative element protein [Pseudomonas aeruginosa]|uniref:TIGR03757 family integrating conjugative element protein n=1 Tax=Pseudomonas triclosanedens TaxID=2961893 RepID=A0ABY7A0Y4_9PSED|nr:MULTISPECIES: TIGR03757 family integrating conjugative element protein [Gammaproteobacteria]MCP8473582.1 TIGR03757 family integrating conjugative element protein [Pseudomonas triclosanedens]MCP8478333.1 TIGR03757 family integrating conjugative element protein [Pseudomonas triclosanedens]HAR06306.1 TIGR03757 family integrating conjugative element protein [Pseudomonas sp.]MCP8464650.1 TIGR03757 family integrating conjugative element protein [Pseudomonas triclosanedens]MCR3872840.1 TIGR03757 f